MLVDMFASMWVMVSRCHTKVESEESILHRLESIQVKNPPWLWNLGQTSLEVQNRGISGPTRKQFVLQNFTKKSSWDYLCLCAYSISDLWLEGTNSSVCFWWAVDCIIFIMSKYTGKILGISNLSWKIPHNNQQSKINKFHLMFINTE